MKKAKRFLCLVICVLLLVSNVPTVFAQQADTQVSKITSQTVYNPLYEGLIPKDESTYAKRYYGANETNAQVAAKCVADRDQLVAAIRTGMENRSGCINIYIGSSSRISSSWITSLFFDAMEETDIPTQGDYLRWVWSTYAFENANAFYSSNRGLYCYKVVFSITYYTTKAQEDVLTHEINRVVDSFNFTNKTSDLHKISTIYDYITTNIRYDYDNLDNENYLLKYTAYAALINKTAVCQGYAVLYYRMAEMCGVDTRVIVGTCSGGNHAWNISRLGQKYYYLDSTWDEGQSSYNYFLRGYSDFPDHYNKSDYSTSEFFTRYPVAASQYIPGTNIDYSFNESNVTLEFTKATYTGNRITPNVTVYYDPIAGATGDEVLLKGGVDYVVSYYDNIDIGTAMVYIGGIGRCAGSYARVYFEIARADLAAPKGLKASLSAYNAAKVTWKKVSGATHYKVYYRNTAKTKYTLLSTTTSLTYKKTGLTPSSTYMFKIVPCVKVGQEIYADDSYAAVSISTTKNLSAPKTVSAKLYGYDDVKVSWSKVSGAKKYKVYYRKSTADTYTLKAITDKTSYNFSNLSDGAKYYFKIVPCTYVNGGNFADDSYKTATAITLKKVSTPTVSKNTSKKVTVKWTNIAGESGYQISKSTSKTGTSIVSTYSTTSGKSKTISAAKGKTYYYKVRAFKTVDGKKIYGPWSSVKAYKLK